MPLYQFLSICSVLVFIVLRVWNILGQSWNPKFHSFEGPGLNFETDSSNFEVNSEAVRRTNLSIFTHSGSGTWHSCKLMGNYQIQNYLDHQNTSLGYMISYCTAQKSGCSTLSLLYSFIHQVGCTKLVSGHSEFIFKIDSYYSSFFFFSINLYSPRRTMISRLLSRRISYTFCKSNNNSNPPLEQQPKTASPPPVNHSLKEQYQKLIVLARPESKKYIKNIVLTGLHACGFMYLPTIYPDLSYLMSLKLTPDNGMELVTQYFTILSKWSLIFGITGFLTYARRYEFLDITNRLAVRLRHVLYAKTLASDIYKKNASSQTYLHHLTTDIKTISEFMGQTIFHGLRGFLFLVGGAASLLYTAPYLSISAIMIMACFNYIFKRKNVVLKELKAAENNALKHTSEYANERFTNSKLIKICDTRDFESVGYLRELTEFYRLVNFHHKLKYNRYNLVLQSEKVSKANGLNYGMLEGVGLFSLFSVAASGALMISLNITDFNLLTSSTYALYVAMGFRSVINFNTEMIKMMGVFSTFQNKVGDLSNNLEYQGVFPPDRLKTQEQRLLEEYARIERQHQAKIDVEFKNVHFRYKNKPKTLRDFSLHIPAGKFVAISGPSGVGKSTLLNLLTGLYNPEQGQIYFNGQELSSISNKQAYIQQTISYVTQDSFVFSGTISSNLIYGNQGADLSEENCIRCLKLAQAYDFVMAKGGLSAKVKEKGSNLSGGEKQRLIMARALVKNPNILVLDEATANVDMDSERKIFDNLKNLSIQNNMTVIIISHKLDLIESLIDVKIDFGKINKSGDEQE